MKFGTLSHHNGSLSRALYKFNIVFKFISFLPTDFLSLAAFQNCFVPVIIKISPYEETFVCTLAHANEHTDTHLYKLDLMKKKTHSEGIQNRLSAWCSHGNTHK